MKPTQRWIKLQLKEDKQMDSRYIIFHTHFGIYAHLKEQGLEIACYEAANYEREDSNPTLYIYTEHEEFYKSCCKYYAHDFDIDSMNTDFTLPENYKRILGEKPARVQLAS